MRIERLARYSTILLLTAMGFFSGCSGVHVIESESAEAFGLQKRLHNEASGGVRMVDFCEAGDYLHFADVPKGKYLEITYSLANAEPVQCSVYVNGKDVATAIFEPTGDWGVYRNAIVRVDVGGDLRLQIDADDSKANNMASMASQDRIAILSSEPKRSVAYKELREVIVENLVHRYAPGEDEDLATKTDWWNKSLTEDGTWPDIEYGQYAFPMEHLERTRVLAAASHRGEAEASNAARALASWVERDFQEEHWWVNEIDVPRIVGDILMLIDENVPYNTRVASHKILRRAWPAPENGKGWGRNALYRARPILMLGVLTGTKPLIAEAIRTISGNIRPCVVDGIQVDWSFQQYGVPCTGGYGMEFLEEAVDLAEMLRDSDFALSPYKLGILSDFLLEGVQPVLRGRGIDPAALGADVANPGAVHPAFRVTQLCGKLIALGAPRADELDAMEKRVLEGARIGGKPEKTWDLEGTRYFWRSGLTAHQAKGYYASMRMASKRIDGIEVRGRRNLRGYHLPDGATWFMRRGDEYAATFAVMDWRHLPGVTCAQDEGPLPLAERGSDDRGSRMDFAGGATDGSVGACGFELDRAGVKAHKAAFFFGSEVVCLGAGIDSELDTPIATTLNQCALRSSYDVHAPPVHKRFMRGSSLWDKPQWFHHDRIGYMLLESARCEIRAARQKGSWHDIDRDQPDRPAALDIFTLWIDHGKKPKDASYAYAVVPDIHVDDMPRYVEESPVAVVANTNDLQAVTHDKQRAIAAVFYKAGSVKTSEGLEITVDAPCILVYREYPRHADLALADALGESPTMRVTINRALKGEGAESTGRDATTISAPLPGGAHAGMSWVGRFGK